MAETKDADLNRHELMDKLRQMRRELLELRQAETESQRLERALRDSEHRIRQIIDSTPVGICVTDRNGDFEYVNPAYCRFYGYAEEELLGRHFTMVVPAEHRAELDQLHTSFLDGGVEIRGEWEVIDKQDRRKVILADAVRVAGDDGQPRKVTYVMDITDRRRAEEEKILREKLQAAVETAGAASHELSQPLQSLLGELEMLLMETGPGDPLHERLGGLLAQAERMTAITKRLLAITTYRTKPYLGESRILDLGDGES